MTTSGQPDSQLIRPEGPDLDAAIERLRALSRQALLDHALAVADFVLGHFFGGDWTRYRDRSAHGHVSLRALCREREAEMAAMGLSLTTLRRYLAAWDRYRRLPELCQRQQTVASLELLGKVADPITREKLALRAAQEQWPAARLRAEVQATAAALARHQPKRGRPRLAPVERSLRQAVRGVRASTVVRAEASASIATLPARRRAALRSEVVAALAELQGWLAALADGNSEA